MSECKDQLHIFLEPGVVARVAAEAFDLDPSRASVPPLDGLDLPHLRAAMGGRRADHRRRRRALEKKDLLFDLRAIRASIISAAAIGAASTRRAEIRKPKAPVIVEDQVVGRAS
jgi:hypothetical protein